MVDRSGDASVGTAPLVLASASPRRTELLGAAGYRFDVDPADVDEGPRPNESPAAYVERLARSKAAAVSARHPAAVVLGADTVVTIDGELLGKPADESDACTMLRRLAGRTHRVMTGVAVAAPAGGALSSAVEVTVVRFRPLDDAEIDAYVTTGEPADKAGAYAIQGGAGAFVASIDGAFDNVVGLPMTLVGRLLADARLTG